MKILVIGSGGREHALVWKIGKSPVVKEIFIAPGNGGTGEIGENVDLAVDDFCGLADFAKKEKIDLTVVGPELPLSLGIVDHFEKRGLRIFGPNRRAAEIESSKILAKRMMRKFKIPTADFRDFSDYEEAREYLEKCRFPKVLKADGLAAGKGVAVCATLGQAKRFLKEIMAEKKFGEAGKKVVIEEYLSGQEVSVLGLTDGRTILPLIATQDHKAIFDDDKGPNTGGMGAYAPVPLIDQNLMNQIKEEILKPTIEGMGRIGRTFRGVLFAGLIITSEGPKVLEFNCRFGDPETQPQMLLLKSDLVELMIACIEGDLGKKKIEWYPGFAVCVVLASGGYPGEYKNGFEIKGLPLKKAKGVEVFHAGTLKNNGKLFANGGRVLGVTGKEATLKKAIENTYLAVKKIRFAKCHYRMDIGAKALRRESI